MEDKKLCETCIKCKRTMDKEDPCIAGKDPECPEYEHCPDFKEADTERIVKRCGRCVSDCVDICSSTYAIDGCFCDMWNKCARYIDYNDAMDRIDNLDGCDKFKEVKPNLEKNDEPNPECETYRPDNVPWSDYMDLVEEVVTLKEIIVDQAKMIYELQTEIKHLKREK